MGLFTGIENAKVTEKLPYIAPGRYLFEIESVKTIESRKGPMFVAEFKVIESEGAGGNPVGSSCSHLIKLALDSALGNVKSFVAALTNEPAAMVSTAMCDRLVSPANPAKGNRVRAEAFLTTKKDGSPFTKVSYKATGEAKAKKSA